MLSHYFPFPTQLFCFIFALPDRLIGCDDHTHFTHFLLLNGDYKMDFNKHKVFCQLCNCLVWEVSKLGAQMADSVKRELTGN